LYDALHNQPKKTGALKMSEINPFNPFENVDLGKFDFTKWLGELKLPGVDVQTLMDNQRKNIEAVVEANKLAVESMKAIAKRQVEMLTESMNTVANASQQMAAKASNPQEMTSKQAELATEAFEKVLANMRELAEMVGKSNSEAFELMNNRFNQSLKELSSLMESQK
jgi:phasin family protein